MGERWRPYRSAAVWYFWQSTRLITTDAPAKAVPKVRQIQHQAKQSQSSRATKVTLPNTTGKTKDRSSHRMQRASTIQD